MADNYATSVHILLWLKHSTRLRIVYYGGC